MTKQMERYYVEYVDHCNNYNQTYIYLRAKDTETIYKTMIDYKIVTIETTE